MAVVFTLLLLVGLRASLERGTEPRGKILRACGRARAASDYLRKSSKSAPAFNLAQVHLGAPSVS
jgi:hypothetical protein